MVGLCAHLGAAGVATSHPKLLLGATGLKKLGGATSHRVTPASVLMADIQTLKPVPSLSLAGGQTGPVFRLVPLPSPHRIQVKNSLEISFSRVQMK